MRVLITGGVGFIGSHLTNRLNNDGAEVTIIDMLGNSACLSRLNSKKIKIIQSQVQNPSIWNQLDANYDLVINTAAETHVDHSFSKPQDFINTNILGLHYVSKFCADHKISLLHLSTDEVVGSGKPLFENSMTLPTNPYSATKAAGENLLHAYGHCFNLDYKVIRLNNVYGTKQFPDKLIPLFINKLNNNQKLPIHGNGKQVRFFLHIDDLIEAIMIILKKGKTKNIYNVATKESYTVLEVAKMICETMGKDSDENIQFVKDRLFQDPTYLSNSDKLHNLGWHPLRTLKETMPELVEWYTFNKDFFNIDRFHNLIVCRTSFYKQQLMKPKKGMQKEVFQ